MAITFDTLQFVNELENAGVERNQASAFVAIVKKAHDNSEIATKGDLRETELRLDSKLEILKAEISLLKWMLGLIGAGILTLIIKTIL